jgi:ribosomal protein S18 acetylase RimI-like enzyme
MVEFSLLNAFEDDKEFIFETFKTTMREYVAWAWGWDEEYQRNGFWTHLPVQNFKLVYVAGSKAGALYVEESEKYHYIRTVFLQPRFQGLGIGSALLTQEACRARNAQKLLVLKVIKINPAKSLYDRQGFKVVEEDDATYHMQLG